MVRAVLFDLDGVLVDSKEVWFQVMRAAGRHFGYPEVSRPAFEATFGQGVEADLRSFFRGLTFEALSGFYAARFMDHRAHFRVDPQAPAVLAALAARGVRTAIVTNTSTPLAREIVAAAGLAPDRLVGSSDVARAKPAPDMVLLACRQLGVGPDAAWMVGDSPYDRDAAGAAAVRFLGYGPFFAPGGLTRLPELLDRLPG